MKQSMRFFAIGLLTASLILLGFYFMLNGSQASSKNIPLEEMIEQIESSGHRVITEKEFIAYTLSNENESEKKDADEKKDDKTSDKKEEEQKEKDKKDKDKDKKDTDKKDKKKDDEKKDKVVKAKFTTKDGVVTQDIADILIDKKIIDDRQKFLDYLDDNNYSPYIQIGTFEVDSDMSMKEIAEIITTYPGN